MATFTRIGSVLDGPVMELDGLSDLEMIEIGGQVFLVAASEASGGMTSFRLMPGMSVSLVDSLGYSALTGTNTLSDLTASVVGGLNILVPSGRYDDRVALHELSGDGRFQSIATQTGSSVELGGFHLSESLMIDGKTFLFAAQWGVQGMGRFRIKDNLSMRMKPAYPDTPDIFLGDVMAMTHVAIGGKMFLFAASGLDAGLQSYFVGRHGNLHDRDRVAPIDGSGFHTPSVLETAVVAGHTYLIMGAAGTDSLTVYKVSNHGKLIEKDHLIDTLDTRFQGASTIEVLDYSGRVFILAAGVDDGITLLELGANGDLTVLTSQADDFDTTLDNVSSIQAHVFGSEIQVFVGSGSEDGFTQFNLDPGNLGNVFLGTSARDTLTGGAGDDIFEGMGHRDFLFGGAGDDRLNGGAGKDFLTGGAGADVFVFAPDGRRDVITDFEMGIDRIDLSQFAGVSHISSLEFKARPWGAAVIVSGEVIRVESKDGSRILLADWSMDDFVF